MHYIENGKENNAMRTSATMIHEKLQKSRLHVVPQMYHGEISINQAEKYVNTILEIIDGV